MVFCEKAASSAQNSNNCISDFPGDNHGILVYDKNVLCILSSLSHRIIKICILKKDMFSGLGFNKINNLHYFIKDIFFIVDTNI